MGKCNDARSGPSSGLAKETNRNLGSAFADADILMYEFNKALESGEDPTDIQDDLLGVVSSMGYMMDLLPPNWVKVWDRDGFIFKLRDTAIGLIFVGGEALVKNEERYEGLITLINYVEKYYFPKG